MAESGVNRFFKNLQDRVFAPMEDPKMPLAQHLEELRVRLTRAVVILAIVFACSFYFSVQIMDVVRIPLQNAFVFVKFSRSEEHTSELQSRVDLVCRLLLE